MWAYAFSRSGSMAYGIVLCLLLVVGFGLPTQGAEAQQAGVIVIGDDRGGYIGRRAEEIRRIRATGMRVEIRGRICYSSCTMYLGADDVCVSPSTTFGFHGPSDHGRPLTPEQFEHWSQIMARHYREPLRTWFMRDARHDLRDYERLSGRDLIRMGYSSC